MKVIFQQDVRGQGKKGEMKEVSEGYGRNYLLPRGLAVEANKDNLNTLALKEKAKKAQEARERAEAEEAAAKLKDVIVTVRAKAGANGRLFGSVTSQEDGLTAVPDGSRSIYGGRLGRRCSAEETAGLMLVSGETSRLTLNFESGGKGRTCEARGIRVRLLPDGSAEVSARFRARNGAALTEREENAAMERLREIVRAAL